MNTVHMTDAELDLTRHAMQAYLRTFGHDEHETVEAIKQVLGKLGSAEHENEDPIFIG